MKPRTQIVMIVQYPYEVFYGLYSCECRFVLQVLHQYLFGYYNFFRVRA